MTNALVVQNNLDLMSLGNVLAKSGFFADSKGEAQAVVKVLAGQELGFGPVASMTGINIIKGRVTLSANLMAAAIKRSGKYNYRIKEHTNDVCRIEFFEHGESLGVSEFTFEDAKKAQLSNGDNWKKFPRNMLFARALSNGAKFHCPDIFGGPIYTPDELGAEIDGETGEYINGDYTVSVDDSGDVVLPPQAQPGDADYKGPEPALEPTQGNVSISGNGDKPAKVSTTQDAPQNAPQSAQKPAAPQNGNSDDEFPTVKRLWPNVASSLLVTNVPELPDGVNIGAIIYPVATSQLGYENSDAVKAAIELDSLKSFQNTVEALMVRVIDKSPAVAA